MKAGQFIALLICITVCFAMLSFSIVYGATIISSSVCTNGSLIYDGLIMIYNALPG